VRAQQPASSTSIPLSDAEQRATELRKKGDELAASRQYAEALAAYEASYALVPSVSLLYNRGRALQFLARYPEALDAIMRFSRDAPADLRARVPQLDELVADLRTKVATLEIRCPTAGARVLLNDRQIAVTPLTQPLRVNAGPAAIEIVADGYEPFRKSLELPGDQGTTLDVDLHPRATRAVLVVHSRMSGVRVSIDGLASGVAPAEAIVTPGEHSVRVEHDGFSAADVKVVLDPGARREVSIDPLEAPFYTRWWFFSGIGAVVAGGVVLGYALTHERAGATGDFSPGSVRVP
jgi:hypothetical protein